MCFDILGLAGLSPIKIEWSRGPLPLSIFFSCPRRVFVNEIRRNKMEQYQNNNNNNNNM